MWMTIENVDFFRNLRTICVKEPLMKKCVFLLIPLIVFCGCETPSFPPINIPDLPDIPSIPDIPNPPIEPPVITPDPEPPVIVEPPASNLPKFPAKIYPEQYSIEGNVVKLFGNSKNSVTHCCIQNANGNKNWEGTAGSNPPIEIENNGYSYVFDQAIKSGDLIVMERGANAGETRNTILWCIYQN